MGDFPFFPSDFQKDVLMGLLTTLLITLNCVFKILFLCIHSHICRSFFLWLQMDLIIIVQTTWEGPQQCWEALVGRGIEPCSFTFSFYNRAEAVSERGRDGSTEVALAVKSVISSIQMVRLKSRYSAKCTETRFQWVSLQYMALLVCETGWKSRIKNICLRASEELFTSHVTALDGCTSQTVWLVKFCIFLVTSVIWAFVQHQISVVDSVSSIWLFTVFTVTPSHHDLQHVGEELLRGPSALFFQSFSDGHRPRSHPCFCVFRHRQPAQPLSLR